MGYRKRKRNEAIDAVCKCGHLKSKHAGGGTVAVGQCLISSRGTFCECSSYKFKSHLYENNHLVRRPRNHRVKVRP